MIIIDRGNGKSKFQENESTIMSTKIIVNMHIHRPMFLAIHLPSPYPPWKPTAYVDMCWKPKWSRFCIPTPPNTPHPKVILA